ncbi:GNAT family N-acetyltransferase [Shewanella surugensis]|uniref:GNAT family N-acetyltransferase n=1 Tax=Shewanella surugensis TaxID=212020 RepID=A0ABT0L5G5_9GAMM|nr:N-acetyltransferase [Shewanella surugensis]MCL1122921.1 GNAT family N-acetyltransferase [Shewanella surugensis]
MHIRKGEKSDLQQLVAFNLAMAKETEGRELDIELLTQGVNRLLDSPEKGFYLVADIDGVMAGSLMVTFEWSDWQAKDYSWIQSVYIHPDHRRKGIYKKLYQAVKDTAEAAGGAASFRLYVEQDNQAAQLTYESMGMQPSHYVLFEE